MRALILAAGLAPFLLAGCASTTQLAKLDDDYCRSIGARPQSQTYASCRLARDQQRSDRQDRALDQIALGAKMMEGPKRTVIVTQQRPVSTSCRQYGQSINCTTY